MTILNFAIKFFRNKYVMASGTPIILNSKGEILLGKRDKFVLYPLMWGLPGGIIEYKEKIEDSIKREIKEEIGVEIKIIKKSNNIYESFPTKETKFHTINIPYFCKITKGIPKPKDETTDVKWFKPSNIKGMKLAYNHKQVLKGEGLLK